jgi:hypothetical protein
LELVSLKKKVLDKDAVSMLAFATGSILNFGATTLLSTNSSRLPQFIQYFGLARLARFWTHKRDEDPLQGICCYRTIG